MTTLNGALGTSMLAFSLLLLLLLSLTEGQALSTPRSLSIPHSKYHFEPTRLWTSILSQERSYERSTMLKHTFQLREKLHHPFVNSLSKTIIAVNTTIASSEVNALLAIRESIHIDPSAALANWSAKANYSYCSTWTGVSCDDMGHVVSIGLADLMLNGTLNPSIDNLRHLLYLNLSGNSLYGDLPSELMRCKSLVVVDLSFNYLDGKLLPGHLYTLPKLEFINLSYNMFSGLLPEVPKNGCPSLTNLRIMFTNLYGPIPSSLNRCKNLRALVLLSNQLSGNIPISLGELHKLEDLELNYNTITGHILSQLASLKDLQVLWLDHNALEGPIPIWLGGMTSLEQLYIGNNHLTGQIPSQLASLKNLQKLDLSNNTLEGPIPISLGGMTALRKLYLDMNDLTGHTPGKVALLKNLQTCSLEYNDSSELGSLKQLQTLTLKGNNLSGPIPPSLQNCSSLQYLFLNDNNLSGTLPSGFEDLTIFWPSLYAFSISNNKLEGNLPLSLASLNSTVAFMDLSRNNFTGGLSTGVVGSHLSSLRVLLISYNQLEGPIPSWIGDLRSLQVLDVSHNKLTGSIPQNFGNLDGYKVQSENVSNALGTIENSPLSLLLTPKGQDMSEEYPYILLETTYMDMSSNALEGEIPTGITNLVGMRYLLLSNNKLEGGISMAFQYLEQLETLDLSQNNLSGVIPTSLPFTLSTFNVSYNNLNGVIPTGNQFNTFDMSSYVPGNPGLCGDVIKRPCIVDNVPPVGDSTPDEYQIFDYDSLLAFAIGVVSGFFVVVAISFTWGPAFDFVFGGEVRRREEEKHYVAFMLKPQRYGLFKYPT